MISGSTHSEVDRRRTILDAATELFDAHGFAGTTTDQLAVQSGITKRTWYRYMRNKEQVLFEIHERFLDRTVMNAVSADGAPVERLRALVQTHVTVVINHQQEIRVFLEDMKHLGPENRAEISRRRGSYEAILGRILSGGMEDGTFPPRDSALLARGILGALTEIYRWYKPETGVTGQLIIEQAVPLFLDGLCLPGAAVISRPEEQLAAGVDEVLHRDPQDSPDARIFFAATELFCKKGYHGANTRELAAAAGLTKSALFYHMGHKEAILSRIHQVVIDVGIEALTHVLNEHDSSAELMTKALIAHCRVIDSYRAAIAVSHDEMKHLTPEARSELGARRGVYESMFRGLISRGIQRGEFHPVNEVLTTRILLGMLNSTYRWYRSGGALSADQIGIRYADLVLRGLRSSPLVVADGTAHV